MARETKAERQARERIQYEASRIEAEKREWQQLEALQAQLLPLNYPPVAFRRWNKLYAWGDTSRERWSVEAVPFWILGANGEGKPVEVTGHLVQRHHFAVRYSATQHLATSTTSIIWTRDTSEHGNGHGNDLHDYSTNARYLNLLGAHSREQLCMLARAIVLPDLLKAQDKVGELIDKLNAYQP